MQHSNISAEKCYVPQVPESHCVNVHNINPQVVVAREETPYVGCQVSYNPIRGGELIHKQWYVIIKENLIDFSSILIFSARTCLRKSGFPIFLVSPNLTQACHSEFRK